MLILNNSTVEIPDADTLVLNSYNFGSENIILSLMESTIF